MSNPRFEALEAEILGYSDRWQQLMGMGWFTVKHTFLPILQEEDPFTIADTEAYWQYRHARISWYLASASRLEPEVLDATVCHELVHCLIAPMETHVKSGHDEHCEFAVESLTRALIEVRNSYEQP